MNVCILIGFICLLLFISDIYGKYLDKNKPIIRNNYCSKCLEKITEENEAEERMSEFRTWG